jgi:hypothetical protein
MPEILSSNFNQQAQGQPAADKPKVDLVQPWRAFFKDVTYGRVEPEWEGGVKQTSVIRLRHEYDDKHVGG